VPNAKSSFKKKLQQHIEKWNRNESNISLIDDADNYIIRECSRHYRTMEWGVTSSRNAIKGSI
jgi:hypothetical protein